MINTVKTGNTLKLMSKQNSNVRNMLVAEHRVIAVEPSTVVAVLMRKITQIFSVRCLVALVEVSAVAGVRHSLEARILMLR